MESKSKFATFLDRILIIIIVFFICFIWLRYYLHNKIVLLVFTSLITFIISSILQLILVGRKAIIEEKNKLQKEINDYMVFLSLQSKKDTINFLSKNINGTTNDDYTIFYKDKEKYILVPQFSLLPLNIVDFQEIYKTYSKKKNVIVLANSYTKEFLDYNEKFSNNIQFLDKNQVFKDYYFDYPKIATQKKKKVKITFPKGKTKSFIFLSVIFTFYAIIFRYNLYYLILASIMLILALYSHFKK